MQPAFGVSLHNAVFYLTLPLEYAAQYKPDMAPTPLSLLNSDDDEPNIPLDVRP